MYLRIGTVDISTLQNKPVFTRVAVEETRYNLYGDTTTDRTGVKFRADITLNLLTETEWKSILDVITVVYFPVSFHDAQLGDITRNFRCSEIPSPQFIVIKGTYYYSEITLALEEQ